MVTFAMPLLFIILFPLLLSYHVLLYVSLFFFFLACFLFPCIFNTRRALTVSPLRNDDAAVDLIFRFKSRDQRHHRGGTCRLATTFYLCHARDKFQQSRCLCLSFTSPSAFDASTLGSVCCWRQLAVFLQLLPFFSFFLLSQTKSRQKSFLFFYSSILGPIHSSLPYSSFPTSD